MKKFKITIKYVSTTEEVHYVCADNDTDALNIVEGNMEGDCAYLSNRSNSNKTRKVEEIFEENNKKEEK